MNRKLIAAGIVVMCLPMVFTTWLMLSAFWPKMDAVTRHLPSDLRSLVAAVVAQRDFARAKRLDADVKAPFERVVKMTQMASDSQPGESVMSPEAKRMDTEGRKLEQEGDECGAAGLFLVADSKEAASDSVYVYAEHSGRASLLCGHLGDAQAGLETAIKKEQRLLQFSIGDESGTQAAMLKDREWLIVVYDRVGETSFAKRVCSAAHPEWESCACKLVGKDVSCAAVH